MPALSSQDSAWLPLRHYLTRPDNFSRLLWVLILIPATVACNVLIGWLFNIPILMQVQPSFVPMQFNTALGFLLACVAIASLSSSKNQYASYSAILLTLLASATLFQYITEINLGIDELFMDAYNVTQTTYPGRMAIGTAACFFLLGVAVLLDLTWSKHQWGQLLSLCASALVIGIGLIALVGYGTGLSSAYGWGLTEMAVHTAFSFSLLGIALNLHTIAFRVTQAMKETFERIAFGVFGLTLFLMTYLSLQADQNGRLKYAVDSASITIRRELANQDVIHNRLLNQLGRQFFSLDESQWRMSTTAVLSARRDLRAVSVLSGAGNALEVFAPGDSYSPPLLQKWREMPAGTPWTFRDHWYYTLEYKASKPGAIETVSLIVLYDLDRMLTIAQDRWVGGNFRIQARLGNETIGDSPPSGTPLSSIELNVLGNDWTLLIYPTAAYISSTLSEAYTAILVLAALFLVALFFVQDLYFRARRNKEQSRILNSRLIESLDAMLDAVVICNERGLITEVNAATLEMFGYEASELLGKNVNLLAHGHHRERHDHYVKNSRGPQEGIIIGEAGNLEAETKSGKVFPVTMRIKRGQDNRGERMFIGVIHDLSEITQAESHRELLDATLNATMDTSQAGWAVIDTQGKIQQVNNAILEWLGYKESDLLNKPISKIYPPEDHAQTEEFLNYLKSGRFESLTRERRYLTSTGEIKWGLASKSSVQSKQENPFIVYQIIDITQQKQLQQDLVDHIVALERSNSELDQFAYVASHDLKSPLNAIAKLSNWIEEDCADILPAKTREYLDLLHSRVNRLTHLLDDLLIYSRVGKQTHEYDYINIEKLSKELLDLNSPDTSFSITATNIDILVPTVPFELVLRNLINNAIKHHDKEQGVIEVYAEMLEEGYKVQVSDNGPGIPEEYREKAMQMFQTLKSRDKTEGSGMGLAICKKTVEYYGGQLFIETSPLGGTTITMMWPIGKGYQFGAKMHEHASHPAPH